MPVFSLLEHWFESDITTGLLRNQTTQFNFSWIANVGVDIYKVTKSQRHAKMKQNLSIVAAKYQLLKCRGRYRLNVANAFLQVLFNKRFKLQKEQLGINENNMTFRRIS
jgi:outer membrane protein